MKQILIKTYGAVGMAQAEAFCKAGPVKTNRIAYWRQNKKTIHRMERHNGVITWQADSNDWWSAKKTVREAMQQLL